mmetsp:Transcript_22443/g.34717  ORF Transcript_22443/g.34717 Transcript_22443/m.34717 type:complete len:112 (+) Transcript_22443:330-665(+)
MVEFHFGLCFDKVAQDKQVAEFKDKPSKGPPPHSSFVRQDILNEKGFTQAFSLNSALQDKEQGTNCKFVKFTLTSSEIPASAFEAKNYADLMRNIIGNRFFYYPLVIQLCV